MPTDEQLVKCDDCHGLFLDEDGFSEGICQPCRGRRQDHENSFPWDGPQR